MQKENKKLKISCQQEEEKIFAENDDYLSDACLFCHEMFLYWTGYEVWIQSLVCKECAHEECSWYENYDVFVCDFCHRITDTVTIKKKLNEKKSVTDHKTCIYDVKFDSKFITIKFFVTTSEKN